MDREQAFKKLDEYCQQRYVEIGERKLERPIIKSYVTETSRDSAIGLDEFKALGEIRRFDEGFCEVSDDKGLVGYLEDLGRFRIFYTLLPTNEIEGRLGRLIRGSYFHDNLWLSGEVFRALLELVAQVFDRRRFIKAVMSHQPMFEELAEMSEDEEHQLLYPHESEFEAEVETFPTSRLQLSNRLERVLHVMDLVSGAAEFRNMVMLRIPARTASGGHDFYSTGKVTNRSSDFRNHRDTVISVVRMYQSMTERIEDLAWLRVDSSGELLKPLSASPVTIRFKRALDQGRFHNFLDLTFEKGRGPFRLWGNLLQRGTNCYHFYGLDLHLICEIFLEVTPCKFTVFLPSGTCGNTVHRLVTNVQRYLDPEIDVFIGDKLYSQLAKEVFCSVESEKPARPT